MQIRPFGCAQHQASRRKALDGNERPNCKIILPDVDPCDGALKPGFCHRDTTTVSNMRQPLWMRFDARGCKPASSTVMPWPLSPLQGPRRLSRIFQNGGTAAFSTRSTIAARQ